MIISASRRTDIPTWYSRWFFHRLKEGYVLVRNPMNFHQVSKVPLTPDVVDGIVFWSKNPGPMLERLQELQDYRYYFQFTLNAYGRDVEPQVPGKQEQVLPTFLKLSDRLGPDRVLWRYDPIFLSRTYTMDYHIRYFERLARVLCGHTALCTISFLDFYRNTRKNLQDLGLEPFLPERQALLAKSLADIARSYGLTMVTCSEGLDLEGWGIGHGCCIDKERFERQWGYPLEVSQDRNQRPQCGCAESIDIGAYDTCGNGCLYCYANHSTPLVRRNRQQHDPQSPLLFGSLGPEDRVTERMAEPCRREQLSFSL